MLQPVRRIITGHDEHGRSIILSDSISNHTRPSPVYPNRGLTDLWRAFESPADNTGDQDNANVEVVLTPPNNGSVFRFFQIPPDDSGEGKTPEELQAAADATFASMGAAHNRDPNARHPNMHKTDSLDYIILLQGEVTLILDEGEVDMKALDVVVQRGTNHAWSNRSDDIAILAGILIDAKPV